VTIHDLDTPATGTSRAAADDEWRRYSDRDAHQARLATELTAELNDPDPRW
jgi:hypothetical protein